MIQNFIETDAKNYRQLFKIKTAIQGFLIKFLECESGIDIPTYGGSTAPTSVLVWEG